ncbi:MAG: hypothetical protein AAGF12_09895, partial [Myxococcota bacterium]
GSPRCQELDGRLEEPRKTRRIGNWHGRCWTSRVRPSSKHARLRDGRAERFEKGLAEAQP